VSAAGLGGLTLLKALGAGSEERAEASTTNQMPGPLAWLWRFGEDGTPEGIRSLLAAHGLGVLMKAHDGPNWMARWDPRSPFPIHGPQDVARIAQFFEAGGVPFHAWGVVNGLDPVREAEMAAECLDVGARSFTFDLELPEGTNYWHGTPANAALLGQALRQRHPNAWLSVAPDPRPWQLAQLPMAEFASFCNDIQPQTYWETFDSPSNHRLFARHGFPVGADGVTPEFLLDATAAFLSGYGKPIRPIGQGAASDAGWQRFATRARMVGMPGLSVWRIGTALPHVWPVLQQSAPVPVPPAAPEAVSETSSAPVEQRVGETSSVHQEAGKQPAPPAGDSPKEAPEGGRQDGDAGDENEDAGQARPKMRPLLERLRFGLGNR
jgi:hypothetical protein